MSGQHAGLLRRVSARLSPTIGPAAADPEPVHEDPGPTLAALNERVARLEAVVEGLQDALYRQSQHHDERMDELRRRTEPDEIARALSEDARRRGL